MADPATFKSTVWIKDATTKLDRENDGSPFDFKGHLGDGFRCRWDKPYKWYEVIPNVGKGRNTREFPHNWNKESEDHYYDPVNCWIARRIGYVEQDSAGNTTVDSGEQYHAIRMAFAEIGGWRGKGAAYVTPGGASLGATAIVGEMYYWNPTDRVESRRENATWHRPHDSIPDGW